MIEDDGKPVGVAFDADRRGYAWFDPALARLQATADKAFPAR